MATKIRILLILLLSIGLLLRVNFTQRSTLLLSGYTTALLPKNLAGHSGEELPLQPFEVAALAPEGGQIVQRSYGNGDTILWLTAVQSRDEWRVQHPPQLCYTSQGWILEEQARSTIRDPRASSFHVQRMIASKDGYRRLVYYFYTDGHYWTASYFRRVMYAFLDRAIYAQARTWMLIQISTPLSDPDAETRVASACIELVNQAPK